MIDLDALHAAMRDPVNTYGQEWDGQDVLALITEFRAARVVVAVAQEFMGAYWDDEQNGTQLQAAIADYDRLSKP